MQKEVMAETLGGLFAKFVGVYLQNGTEILRLGFHSPLVTIWMGVSCKKTIPY